MFSGKPGKRVQSKDLCASKAEYSKTVSGIKPEIVAAR